MDVNHIVYVHKLEREENTCQALKIFWKGIYFVISALLQYVIQ